VLLLPNLLQFSVLRYESVIHEFDPYFNYRSTIKLVTEVRSIAPGCEGHCCALPQAHLPDTCGLAKCRTTVTCGRVTAVPVDVSVTVK
jgi:hypothetical protein